MKFARIVIENECRYAVSEGDNLRIIEGTPFGDYKLTENIVPNAEATFTVPVLPSKIVAVGKNYHAHALEMNEGEPTEPLLFLKPSTCIIGHGDSIVYPSISKRLDYEGELGVVIGKRCRNVSAHDAYDYILGYLCLNDVTARDIQKSDSQWTRGKGFDTFCPIGRYIVTDIDASNLGISTKLNGMIVQKSVTSAMTHNIPKLIEYISRVMTLLPGDIIATGTPEGIGPMQVGDTVEVTIEAIDTLTNTVVAEQ